MASSDIQPPDLEMRVRLVLESGQTRLFYTLHSPAGVAPFSQKEIEGPKIKSNPESFLVYLQDKIKQLEDRYTGDQKLLIQADLGRQLWAELFSAELCQAYRTIRRTVSTWMIVTDEPWIPWELIKPYDDSLPESVIDDDFLGRQFQLTRWLAGSKPPFSEIEIRRLAAIQTAKTLPQEVTEKSHLAQLALRSGVEDVSSSAQTLDTLLSFLQTSGAQLIHFSGHGTFDSQQADESAIPLPDGQALRPSDLAGPVRTRIGQDRSLVFLNACWKGPQGWSLTRNAAWASRWMDCGCGAFIAPLWPIRPEEARDFARVFYEALWHGETLGQAAQQAREYLRVTLPPSDPSVLAYTIYGNPNARVLFGEDANLRNAPPAIRERIYNFGPLIRRKTEGFVGRQWLFDAVDRFVAAESRGYVQILGDPGIGKTAIIAEMVKRHRHPHHFNIRSEGIQKPEHFLSNLCAQLVARFHLSYSTLPPEVSRDATILNSLLEEAAIKLRPAGRKLVILIDALDESDEKAMTRGSNNLYLPADLPEGVFFVVTSRRGGTPLRYSCPGHQISLERETSNNFVDIRLFAETWLDREGIQAYIRNQGLDDTGFVDVIVKLSEGNFMYPHYVLLEIEKGTYKDRKFAELPAGLENYYEDHWHRMRALDVPAWQGYKLPILVALTLAKEPISMDLIANFSGVKKRSQIRAALDEWAAFLRASEVEENGTKETRWQFYHESFHSFITAKSEVQDELVDLKSAHEKAAAAVWDALYPEDPGILQVSKDQDAFRIEKLSIRNLKNIDSLELNFSASSLGGVWTCIAGLNGSGKTTILQALTIALLGPNLVPDLGSELLRRMRRRIESQSLSAEVAVVIRIGEKVQELFLPLSDRGVDLDKLSKHPDHKQMLDLWRQLQEHLIVAYGASRSLSEYLDTRHANLNHHVRRQMTLFDPLTQLVNAEILLKALPPGSPAARTLRTLLENVLAEETPSGASTDRLVFRQCGTDVEAIDLPDGFRSTVAWLADLCVTWQETTPAGRNRSANLADIRGIVLLDEIDLHLHPSLQRTLVPRLRKALPNVQFIVTTHSPLILSSFDRNEIVALDRDAEGGVRVLDRQIFGFSADQIYQWLMGTLPQSIVIEEKLDNPADPEVALLLTQSEELNEEQARVRLEERRRLIEHYLDSK